MTPRGWYRLPNWVLDRVPEIGLPGLGILSLLARRANSKGISWPSLTQISETLDLTRRHVIRTLKRLEDLGLVEIQRGGGGRTSNIYHLTLERGDIRATSEPEREVTSETPLESGRGDMSGTGEVTSPPPGEVTPEHLEQDPVTRPIEQDPKASLPSVASLPPEECSLLDQIPGVDQVPQEATSSPPSPSPVRAPRSHPGRPELPQKHSLPKPRAEMEPEDYATLYVRELFEPTVTRPRPVGFDWAAKLDVEVEDLRAALDDPVDGYVPYLLRECGGGKFPPRQSFRGRAWNWLRSNGELIEVIADNRCEAQRQRERRARVIPFMELITARRIAAGECSMVELSRMASEGFAG